MTTQLELRTGQFTIHDLLAPDEGPTRCTVHISVKTLRYQSGDLFYDLSYQYEYTGELAHHLNPFHDSPTSASSQGGDIIKKNAMTEGMIGYLLMSDQELSKQSGHTHPTDYRANIMRALAMFWD